MRTIRAALLLCCLLAGRSAAQDTPSWSKHIKPVMAKYCVECHTKDDPDGGLSLDSYKNLMKGGDHGKALEPGKADQSRLVRMVEGKSNPKMPPKKARQPMAAEIAQLRAWVEAGAKDDEGKERSQLTAIVPRHKADAAVTALAYLGHAFLFAARDRSLAIVDLADNRIAHERTFLDGKVTALTTNGGLLALATSHPGKESVIRLAGGQGIHWTKIDSHPGLRGHTDSVHALAFSPDGELLASTGYDRVVKLWQTATGKHLRDLKDHSDAVYGLCFSPDGKLLASAGADRAVKVWDVESGVRLYTLGESTDWVYAVAWHPEGKRLAAAGVDRSIRVWEVKRDGGSIVHSVFAHEGPVTKLVYSGDGKTLYSASDDRHIKAWESSRMVERHVYEAQSDTPMSLAVRADGKQLAVGRFDGALVLLDEKTGKVQAQPLPVKPKPPVLKKLTPSSGRRGKPIRFVCEAEGTPPLQLVGSHPGTVSHKEFPHPLDPLQKTYYLDVTFPATTPAGIYQLRLKNEAGESAPVSFTADPFDEVKEVEPNDSPRTGQKIVLSATLAGALDRAGAVDFCRFEAKAGQQVGVQVQTSSGTLEPALFLFGPDGQELASSTTGVLGYTCVTAGEYALGLRDRDFRGGSTYRLHVGELPVVTSIYPLGVQRGSEAVVRVEGVHLGNVRTVPVKVDVNAALGSRIPLSIATALGTPLGNLSIVVGEFPDVLASSDSVTSLPVGATANGRLLKPDESNSWRFTAKKGERLLLDMEARRLGAPLDSTIEILDARGMPLPRAVLRCVSRTYSTFRDHDSFGSGIRIETWSELAVNDYIYLNNELLRILALPKNPDDDCQFFSKGGRRLGFLGTTPGQLSLGTPMYKVTLHPPGTAFPPNGLPLITLFWRNDDGEAAFGKDSHLTFDPPADGEYQVRIGDTRGEGGPQHVYRLTLRRPRPDFSVSFTPSTPSVWQGGAIPVTVNVDRRDGFDGEVQLKLDNLPPGFSAPTANVLAGENSTAFALHADAAAKAGGKPLKLMARATIDGKEVMREASGGLAKTMPVGDITTTTDQSEVAVKPGGQVRLTVRIERHNKFAGRIPLDVKGLPHGVRVLDIGLSGILITPSETMRTIVIQCDPWVQPTAHPFVVLARREGKNTEHAAKSVLLRVAR